MGRRKTGKRQTGKAGKPREKSGIAIVATSEGDATEGTGKTGIETGSEAGASTGTEAGPATTETGSDRMGILHVTTDNEAGTDAGLAALEREANAALAGAPEGDALTEGAEGGELEPAAPQEWEPFLQGMKPLLFGFVLPQWEVTEPEQREWTQSLAQCMDQLFPGGPAGQYACYVRLAAVSVAIVGGRMIANGGKLPPIGPKRATPPASDASTSTAAASA